MNIVVCLRGGEVSPQQSCSERLRQNLVARETIDRAGQGMLASDSGVSLHHCSLNAVCMWGTCPVKQYLIVSAGGQGGEMMSTST